MAVHVVPVGDSKAHIEAGEYCHCAPRLQRESGDVIVIHNAYDGREFYEQGGQDDPLACPDCGAHMVKIGIDLYRCTRQPMGCGTFEATEID